MFGTGIRKRTILHFSSQSDGELMRSSKAGPLVKKSMTTSMSGLKQGLNCKLRDRKI